MSTVLIIGASRGIGLETVRIALKAGHSVRAIARSATAIRLDNPKLEKLDGDALDQHAIEHALVGTDAVIQTLGVSPTPERIVGGTRLFSTATRIPVDAMAASAVRRLICVTGLGAGDSHGRGGFHVRYAPDSGGKADIATLQLCANSDQSAVLHVPRVKLDRIRSFAKNRF
jgi:NAD(P)-dependent dehydrogenase (short-subunit alcohol dehydrogenase family)